MVPFTQNNIKWHLHEATTSKTRKSKYDNLLGFRKLKISESSNGRPVYRGKVKEFYDAIKKIAPELSKKYESLEKLRKEIETQETFTESLIDNVLEQHGSEIWNDGQSGFLTRLDDPGDDDPVYLHHLIYNDELDRIKIRTLVYCYALKSMCMRMRNGIQSRDDAIIPQELPCTAPRGPRPRRLTVTATNKDTTSIEPTRTVPTFSASSNTSENGRSQDACEYQVPVAQMFRTLNTEGVSSSSTVAQPSASEASLVTKDNFTTTEHRSMPSLGHASEMTVGQGKETGGCLPLRKRRRSLYGEVSDADSQPLQLSESTGRSVRRKRGITCNVSPSTSPNVTLEIPDKSADQRPKETFSNRTTRHNAIDGASTQCQPSLHADTNDDTDEDAIGITTLQIHTSNGHISEGSIRDADSVTGSSRLSPEVVEQDADNGPTLIGKLNDQDHKEVRQLKRCRTKLAIALLRFFEISSEQPKALEQVITLIKDIRELYTPLLQGGSGGRHASDGLVLDQWLDLVGIYLRFRKDIASQSIQRTESIHGDSLESTGCLIKLLTLKEACLEVEVWSSEHENHETDEWSKCVISTLLEMANLDTDLTTEDTEGIRKRFVKFNEGLVQGRLPLLPP